MISSINNNYIWNNSRQGWSIDLQYSASYYVQFQVLAPKKVNDFYCLSLFYLHMKTF
jgi:hypothetical protein